MDKLTYEQLRALHTFASTYGRYWKTHLRQCWMTGNYHGCAYAGTLQQIRNQFGPSWLTRFSLRKNINHN